MYSQNDAVILKTLLMRPHSSAFAERMRGAKKSEAGASSVVCKTATDGPTTQRSVARCSPPLHTVQWCSIQAACRLNATSPNLQDLVSIKSVTGA